MPTMFIIDDSNIRLSYGAWESLSDWKEKKQQISFFIKPFIDSLDNVIANYPELFNLINDKIFEFLEVSKDKWKLDKFSIDLNNLIIDITATHKERNQTTTLLINSPLKFNEVKLEHPELVNALIQFVIGYGKANSEFLYKTELLG